MEEINLKTRNLKREDNIISIRPEVNIDDTVLSGETEIESDAAAATAIGYIMGFLTYIVLLIYGSMVMRGVMEEKSSRIIEVIISSSKTIPVDDGENNRNRNGWIDTIYNLGYPDLYFKYCDQHIIHGSVYGCTGNAKHATGHGMAIRCK